MKRTNLLLAFLLSLLGTGYTTAATLTENFDEVTVNSDYQSLSNGWFVQNAQIFGTPDYFYYGIGSDSDYKAYGGTGKSLYSYNGASAQNAYVIVPQRLTGTLTFNYRADCNSRSSFTPIVRIFQVTESEGVYTVGEQLGETISPTKGGDWADAAIDLGADGKMVAIQLFRSYIDNFSATIFEDDAEVKAVEISAFAATTPTVDADLEGKYSAAFTATVASTGNVALTAADNVTVSLLDAAKNVLATSAPLELAAGEAKDVALTYDGTATADGAVTFYAQENLGNKLFATEAVVTIKLAGPRFQIAPEGSSDFGLVKLGDEASKSYTITNNGTTPMSVSTTAPEGFTATPSLTVNAGETAELTVTMNTETTGQHSGTVVLTTDAVDTKTYELPVSGLVYDPNLFFEDFSAGTLPEGWEQTGAYWTFADGVARASYNYAEKSYLATPALAVVTGDKLVFQVRPTASYVYVNVTVSKNGADYGKFRTFYFERASDAFQTVTIDDLEPGSYRFRFESDDYELDNFNGLRLDIQAPALAVTLGGAAVETGAAANFGSVKAQPAPKTYTVSNTGTGTLEVAIASSDESQFTVSESSMTLGTGESKTFDLALVYDENYGAKAADITITPTYDANAAVVVKATATTYDPEVWEENFENGTMPPTWLSEGWEVDIVDDANGTYMATISSRNNGTLTTPRLRAEAGDKLTFEAFYPWYDEALLVEYSTDDQQTWTEISNYKPEDDGSPNRITRFIEFTAPVEGYYHLRLTSRYASVDNFIGFKSLSKEHELKLIETNVPATGAQFEEYTATVTVHEEAGKEETATATLYVDGTAVATVEQVVIANNDATFTLSYTPTEAFEAAETYIAIAYEDGELTTEPVLLTVAPAFTLDETASPGELEARPYKAIFVNFNAEAGWNTIALPFSVADVQATFGEGTKAYKFSNYGFNTMMYEEVTALEGGVPYVLHNTTAISGPILFMDVEITETGRTPQTVTKSNVNFIATYAPIAAADLEGKHVVEAENGSLVGAPEAGDISGFRGYFVLPETLDLAKTVFSYTNADGTIITTGISNIAADGRMTGEGTVYDLQGRKLVGTQLPKGIYIVNGKKIAVK